MKTFSKGHKPETFEEACDLHYSYAKAAVKVQMFRFGVYDEEVLVDSVHTGLMDAYRTYRNGASSASYATWVYKKSTFAYFESMKRRTRKKRIFNMGMDSLDLMVLPETSEVFVQDMSAKQPLAILIEKETTAEISDRASKILKASQGFDRRASYILEKYFFEGWTCRKIGEHYGLSESWAFANIKKIFAFLREYHPNLAS